MPTLTAEDARAIAFALVAPTGCPAWLPGELIAAAELSPRKAECRLNLIGNTLRQDCPDFPYADRLRDCERQASSAVRTREFTSHRRGEMGCLRNMLTDLARQIDRWADVVGYRPCEAPK